MLLAAECELIRWMTDRSALLTSITDINFKTGRPGKDRKLLKSDIANLEKNQTERLEIKRLRLRTRILTRCWQTEPPKTAGLADGCGPEVSERAWGHLLTSMGCFWAVAYLKLSDQQLLAEFLAVSCTPGHREGLRGQPQWDSVHLKPLASRSPG